MHRLFVELVPGGAPVKKSASQYKTLLATARPRDLAGKTRRRIAAGELAGIERLDAKLKAMKAELKAAVLASGSRLMDLHGIGPAGAARILADVGDVARFPSRSHFASRVRHRPDRRLQRAAHPPPAVPRRQPADQPRALHGRHRPGSATTPKAGPYYRRRLQQSKTSMEAMRCLRRRLPDVACRQLVADAPRHQAGPGGHSGAALKSSAADLTPDIGSSDKPLPGPALPTLLPAVTAGKPAGPGIAATPRRRAGGVNVERPTRRTTLTPTSAGAPSKASRPQTP